VDHEVCGFRVVVVKVVDCFGCMVRRDGGELAGCPASGAAASPHFSVRREFDGLNVTVVTLLQWAFSNCADLFCVSYADSMGNATIIRMIREALVVPAKIVLRTVVVWRGLESQSQRVG